jgi:drug/metabolite transporter (DMT)-like permease
MMLAATAFALLTASDTIFKLLASDHPAYQILLINGCFALIPIVVWSLLTGGLARLRTSRPLQHLVRGGTSVMSAFAAIYAYSRLPLTDFYAIIFAGPLIVTAMSAFWLNEKVEPARWLAIIVGFSGIMIVADPFKGNGTLHADPELAGRFAAFVAVFCYALSVVMVRRMRMGESNMAFSFYGYIACILMTAFLFLWHGGAELTFGDVARLAASGTCGGIASICLMTAYHRTPVALVAPFQYTQIVWGALAGYCLWEHIPSARLGAGAAVVIASGLFVIYREIRSRETA